MPNPKRRHSKTRTAKRRTHDALKPVAVGTCPQCHESKLPHQVCPHCGYYKGRQVREVEEA
jgi:large subunit ribosomal protein L32